MAAFAAIVVTALAAPAVAPAITFTVNDVGDQADAALNGSCDTDTGTSGEQCSLRAAIQEANNLAGPDAIQFSIGVTAPVEITPAGRLPALTSPVTIDGLTQPGAYSLGPGVELDATNETGGHGLEFSSGSGGSVVRGLMVNRAPGYGLELGAQTVVMATWVGTDSSGLLAAGNTSGGIHVTTGGAGSVIGVADQLRNVISGNGGPGVEVDAGPVSIQNSYIGTNYVGWTPLGNNGPGVLIADGAAGDTIGGTASGAGNVISGNAGPGIEISGSTAPIVAGNTIGLNAGGEFAIGNAGDGVALTNAPDAVVGLNGAAGRNVISANAANGVDIGTGSAGAAVNGNYIGLRADGTGAAAGSPLGLGNGADGIAVASTDASIGESAANVIAGQTGAGIGIAAAGATVVDNLVGSDAAKATALGNGGDGIRAEGFAGGRIGSPGHGNVIVASGRSAIRLAATTGVYVQGNGIGIDGNFFFGPNGGGGNAAGIDLRDGTAGTIVGGTGEGEANLISSQLGTGDGISLSGAAGSGNRIRGNSISINGGLGIDLGADGVTANDASDADDGWNELQNFPIITDAARSLDTLRVYGFLDTAPGQASYSLDLFLSTECDQSGNGEGEQYLGTRTVQTNSGGYVAFSFELPARGAAPTNLVTATATSPGGDTSELSPCSNSPYSGTLEIQPSTMPVREPGGQVALDVVRVFGRADTISVDYATSDGSATAPDDYVATSGTLVFRPGETLEQIVVPVNDDKIYEGDETFTVTLSNPVFTAIPGAKSSVVTIIENDPYRPAGQAVAGVKTGGSTPKAPAVKRCKVPKLKGLTKKKAQAKLKKARCRLGKVRKTRKKAKSKKLRNRVVTQKPAAGKKVRAGTKVSLTLGRR